MEDVEVGVGQRRRLPYVLVGRRRSCQEMLADSGTASDIGPITMRFHSRIIWKGKIGQARGWENAALTLALIRCSLSGEAANLAL